MKYHDMPERTGCGTCNSCKYHSMDGHNHQCQNPDKPETWHKFINTTFARNYHDCCILYDEGTRIDDDIYTKE